MGVNKERQMCLKSRLLKSLRKLTLPTCMEREDFSLLFALHPPTTITSELACKQRAWDSIFSAISPVRMLLSSLSRMDCLFSHNVLFVSSPPHIGSLGESFTSSPAKQLSPTMCNRGHFFCIGLLYPSIF
ncbi:hypothetical protein CEXT_361091 [Caerostris extrusa]|uniref:Uncharacterized protein n=1 Tax=Caerostris extrusa TaxID=172846 RepID=A0AAV4PHR9_CAEEX|nr:hypothetical protein CEXT_361091 [Caerostris extrusa]